MANDEEHVPPVGRYNAGQKLVFWLMTLLILVLFVSGLAIWDVYFFGYTTIEQKRIAVLMHSLAAVAIIRCGSCMSMRRYGCAAVRGMTRGMLRRAGPGGIIANG